jgi:hypothetical protein
MSDNGDKEVVSFTRVIYNGSAAYQVSLDPPKTFSPPISKCKHFTDGESRPLQALAFKFRPPTQFHFWLRFCQPLGLPTVPNEWAFDEIVLRSCQI